MAFNINSIFIFVLHGSVTTKVDNRPSHHSPLSGCDIRPSCTDILLNVCILTV